MEQILAQSDAAPTLPDAAQMTLDEYIKAYHDLVYMRLKVEPEPIQQAPRSISMPYGRIAPRYLRQWTDFHDVMVSVLSEVYGNIPLEKRLFDSCIWLEGEGSQYTEAPFANVKMLEHFIYSCVEKPLVNIIYELIQLPKFQRKLNMVEDLVFDHCSFIDSFHASAEPQSRQPSHQWPSPWDEPNQICVYHELAGTEKRTAISISQYKLPQELSLPQLRAGLRDKDIDMTTVSSADKGPMDHETEFNQSSLKVLASAITQVYHEMVKTGLVYGLITTGQATLFLKVDWDDDPTIVHYHLADSAAIISHHLAFHVLALQDFSRHGQDARNNVFKRLITQENPTSPSRLRGQLHETLEFCTHKCLLGLVDRDLLDPECPNFRLHSQGSTGGGGIGSRHPISHHEFLQLLSRQLASTLDYGITPLGMAENCGVVFEVTLLDYGYKFISKGTMRSHMSDLKFEAQVYSRLKAVQGVHVPVFLGAIDLQSLNRTYFYDFGEDIVHLCFMSWGGRCVWDVQGLDRSTLQSMAVETVDAIHHQGVIHQDAGCGNILFDPRMQRIMVIDFERSRLLSARQRLLAAVAHNEPCGFCADLMDLEQSFHLHFGWRVS
ncbi:hypothetical protein F4777DRAFT_593537 [Nemania sp. FL0916]|nr:hypothetical protein F4777DRAFT_593537 [Nemania sp. FL0916]